jgi:hypothetical protein
MEYHVRINLLGTALALALGIGLSVLASTIVVSRAMDARLRQQIRRAQDITVKGSARMRVRADVGVWTVTIQGSAPQLPEAFAVLQTGVAKVRDFLASQGFKPEDLRLDAIETTTHYQRNNLGQETRDIAGYTLSRLFTVSTPDVARVAAAAGEVTQLIRDGVRVASSAPRYYYSRLADLKVQILGEASKDARARADEIVRNSGGRVGPVRDAHMSPLQITQPNSTDFSGGGAYDTSTIDKDITAVVTVTFGVEAL